VAEPAPAPPAKKPAGPLRWILLGCGALTGLAVLGMAGCFGIMYLVYSGTEPIAAVGADYLKNSSEIRKALGPEVTVKRHKTGWNVHTVNDGGNARITYTAQGSSGAGEAVVWLVKTAGAWSAVGARLRLRTGDTVEAGKPPQERHRVDWDD